MFYVSTARAPYKTTSMTGNAIIGASFATLIANERILFTVASLFSNARDLGVTFKTKSKPCECAT